MFDKSWTKNTHHSYLNNNAEPKTYAANLESIIIGTLYRSLNSKKNITEHDKEIIDIMQSTLPNFEDEDFEITESDEEESEDDISLIDEEDLS